MNYRDRERLAVRIGVLLTQRFERDEGALPIHSVCEVLHENEATVSAVIADLKKVRLVEVTASDGIMLAKSPETLASS